MRNLSEWPVTEDEKKKFLEKKLLEFRNQPTGQARFGDLTGAILLALLKDVEVAHRAYESEEAKAEILRQGNTPR
jgi:hypothetical protein